MILLFLLEPYSGDIEDYFSSLIFSTKADYLFLSYSSLIFAASFSELFYCSSFRAISAFSSLSYSILFSYSSYSFLCSSCSTRILSSAIFLCFSIISRYLTSSSSNFLFLSGETLLYFSSALILSDSAVPPLAISS